MSQIHPSFRFKTSGKQLPWSWASFFAHKNEEIHLGSRPGKGAKSGRDTQRNLD